MIKQKKKIKKIKNQEINSENKNKDLINNSISNSNKAKKQKKKVVIINKPKLEQLLMKKESDKFKKINIVNKIINIKSDEDVDILNSNKNNNLENSSRSKIAKKSAHNRNVEQNFIFNSNSNTSLLSTMKDSNYYSQESKNLSKYITDYYQSHLSYPPTDLSFYKF